MQSHTLWYSLYCFEVEWFTQKALEPLPTSINRLLLPLLLLLQLNEIKH